MSFVAIIGAGALGGALAHALAGRDRTPAIRLIDSEAKIAEGKALDILQASPVEHFTTRISSSTSLLSASGADVVVLADSAAGSAEHDGENGLALLRRLTQVEGRAPIVFAGARQRLLIRRAIDELHLAPERLVGSAPVALEAALRALVGVALDGSAVAVTVRVAGVPPKSAVVAWQEATAYGQPLASELPAHVMAGITARIPGLWPPGPYALAAAAARIVEAVVSGSRNRYSCFVATGRSVAAMPVELGQGGVRRVHTPVLTPQERTLFESSLLA